jgi:hypothetical protein
MKVKIAYLSVKTQFYYSTNQLHVMATVFYPPLRRFQELKKKTIQSYKRPQSFIALCAPHLKWFLPSSPEALRINRCERPLLAREGT